MAHSTVGVVLLFTSLAAFGGSSSRPEVLVAWDSEESAERLERSEKADFFSLTNHFVSQPDGVVCGPTSASIVLNALRKESDSRPKTEVPPELLKHLSRNPGLPKYTPRNLFSAVKGGKTIAQVYGEPIQGKKDFGFQVRQLHGLLKAAGASAQLRVVDDKLSVKAIRKEIRKNLQTRGDYVLVNYKRVLLGQKGGGHISPLGAYDPETDSVLLMDVNPNRARWVWVPLENLVAAMRSFDTVENRGYVLVTGA